MTRPEPTRRERNAWVRLVREAEACAQRPGRTLGDLRSAAGRAAKAVVPLGQLSADNAFVRLVRLAERFVAADAPDRHGMKTGLAAVAAECRALLEHDDAEGAGRPARLRADIDG